MSQHNSRQIMNELINAESKLPRRRSNYTEGLFIHGLFNDSVSTSGYTASNERMNNELERIWKEAVIT
jgi:hypothetical protein